MSTEQERRQALFKYMDVYARYHRYRAAWYNSLHSASNVFIIIGPLVVVVLLSSDSRANRLAVMLILMSIVLVCVFSVVNEILKKKFLHDDLCKAFQHICLQLRVHPEQDLSLSEWREIDRKRFTAGEERQKETILCVLMARAKNDFCDANGLSRVHTLRWWHLLTIQTNLFSKRFSREVELSH